MMSSFEKRIGLFFKAAVILAIVLTGQPDTGHAGLLSGTDIPLIDGARIIKEKQFQGSASIEMEVDMPPARAAEYYRKVLQDRGWPSGKVLSIADQSMLALSNQGDRFILRAILQGGHTHVSIAFYRDPKASRSPASISGQPEQQSGKTALDQLPTTAKAAPVWPSGAAASQDRLPILPTELPVADHRLTMLLTAVDANGSLEPDQPLAIHFTQPVDPAFFDFTIIPEKNRWTAQWSSNYKRVSLVPEISVEPGQSLQLKAIVLGGPVIERTISIRRLPPERQLTYDLKAGRISFDQATKYRLFSVFKPSQVPEIYRLKRTMRSVTPILEKVQKDFDQLDASTRRELEPFFLSPLDPESYWYSKLQKESASSHNRFHFNLISSAWARPFPLLREVYTTENGHDLVITGLRQQAGAIRRAHDLLQGKRIYERFRDLLNVDVPLTETNRIGIFIFDTLLEPSDDPDEEDEDPYGLFYRDWGNSGEPTICISASQCNQENLLGATLSHELFHAFQKAFKYNYTTWLAESTAVWSEHYIDKTWNTEQDYIRDAFEAGRARTVKLDTDSSYGPYGVYLFPYYLTEVTPKDELVIRRIWHNCNDTPDAIEAVKKAVGGDFDSIWRKFSLATLDVPPKDKSVPDRVVPQFGGQAPLEFKKVHGFTTITLNHEGGGAADVVLNGIQTAYVQVVNNLQGPSAPAIRVDLSPFQQYTGRVSVQSIIYFRDGRREYEDWSNREERLFCLNKPSDNFTRIYIAIGCSDHQLAFGETLSISAVPTSRCYSGALILTRTFEERETLESTRRIVVDTTEIQSRRSDGSRSVTLHLELDLKEKLLPEQKEALDLMETRVPDVKPERVRKVRKAMENIIKTPHARMDKKTGLMKVDYRVKACRIAQAGGAYRSRSEGERTDNNGTVEQWETNFSRKWTGTGLNEQTRKSIERGHIRAEIYYEPESGVIKWVCVPQLDIDMHVTETGQGFHRRRTQNGYKTTPKSSNTSKEESFQMTFSSGGKAREGLPMDPVWRARQSSGLSASGKACIENPIDHEYSEPNKKGFRKGMLTESFEWSLNLSDSPADQ
ncbi:hypothetical protein [uncultured Desulfosarcina sp.]|uniref:hypothetical protein n=1 Tax=uncultured Desulfosarcina sp. TaxID=218289 RepID=UPI0029C7079E|nr:hypothetical protein [uncultured Desulfosarcina sp.]